MAQIAAATTTMNAPLNPLLSTTYTCHHMDKTNSLQCPQSFYRDSPARTHRLYIWTQDAGYVPRQVKLLALTWQRSGPVLQTAQPLLHSTAAALPQRDGGTRTPWRPCLIQWGCLSYLGNSRDWPRKGFIMCRGGLGISHTHEGAVMGPSGD